MFCEYVMESQSNSSKGLNKQQNGKMSVCWWTLNAWDLCAVSCRPILLYCVSFGWRVNEQMNEFINT